MMNTSAADNLVQWLFLDINAFFASCEQQETPRASASGRRTSANEGASGNESARHPRSHRHGAGQQEGVERRKASQRVA
jgi:hypothetical protein